MAPSQDSLTVRLDRWASRLQNLTVSPLTRDYPEQDNAKRAIEAFELLELPRDVQGAALGLSRLSGCSPFVTFLTAYVVLVSRLIGDEDIALGTSTAEDGRPFVIRVPVSFEESFESLQNKVAKVGKAYGECSNDIVPLGSLRNHIQEATKSEKTPILFRFAAFDAPAASQDYPANTFDTTDLVLNITIGNEEKAELGAYYNQRLFSSNRISTILAQLTQVARNAATNPGSAIGKIDFMTPTQQETLTGRDIAALFTTSLRRMLKGILIAPV
ncbi:large subunit of alpha-aminoadipate reductase [Ascosphaera atra]|nr:large subunit of alpha-aminoadipate reductase [Ascosphaera atra]